MPNKFICLVALSVALLVTRPAAADGLDALSSWVNQDGSVFTITSIGSDGSISGTYVNNASGYSCQGTPYAVNGWAFGSVITFSVLWDNATQNCNSLTGWTGYVANSTITTNWNIAVSGQQTIYTGRDVFKYLAKTESNSLIAE